MFFCVCHKVPVHTWVNKLSHISLNPSQSIFDHQSQCGANYLNWLVFLASNPSQIMMSLLDNIIFMLRHPHPPPPNWFDTSETIPTFFSPGGTKEMAALGKCSFGGSHPLQHLNFH